MTAQGNVCRRGGVSAPRPSVAQLVWGVTATKTSSRIHGTSGTVSAMCSADTSIDAQFIYIRIHTERVSLKE